MTDPSSTTPPAPKPVTRIALVLDASGSMQALGAQALATFNDYLRAIREAPAQEAQDTSVSILTFANAVTSVAFNLPAARVREVPASQYRPGGQTALYDAVGRAIDDFRAMPDANAEHVSHLIMAITDGEENASFTYLAPRLARLIATVQATDRYSVAFLVPRGSTNRLAALRLPPGNIREWETTVAGMRETQGATAAAFDGYLTSRASGQRSTNAFFVNVANLNRGDVQAACRDIAANVSIYPVRSREDIREFCERVTGVPYVKGQAFYELTKGETIQHHKDVMIVEKGRTAVYSGIDARKLLGLPEHADVKVKPGDSGNWDVFVQSTSMNRKLEAGTRLIVLNRAAP